MFGWFKKNPAPELTDKEKVRAALEMGKCPDCGSKDFYQGPSGGICTNYQCAGCGSKFNVGGALGTLMIADRI